MIKNDHDEFLAKQAASGNIQAFERLVELYTRRIGALGMSFFKNAADAEDFIQDVFLKLFTKIKDFRGESLFSTWFTRIAYNTALNSVTRRKEYESIADEEALVAKGGTPEQEQIKKITCQAIRECVDSLPKEYSACLDMYFFYGMPYKEISKALDKPENTVKSYIFRAKKTLREKLEDFYGE